MRCYFGNYSNIYIIDLAKYSMTSYRILTQYIVELPEKAKCISSIWACSWQYFLVKLYCLGSKHINLTTIFLDYLILNPYRCIISHLMTYLTVFITQHILNKVFRFCLELSQLNI